MAVGHVGGDVVGLFLIGHLFVALVAQNLAEQEVPGLLEEGRRHEGDAEDFEHLCRLDLSERVAIKRAWERCDFEQLLEIFLHKYI